MNSSRHSLVAFLLFQPARNNYWAGVRGRTEFAVEYSGAGCLLGSAEIGLIRYEIVSASIHRRNGLIGIRSIKERCWGRYYPLARSFPLHPRIIAKKTYQEAHSLETVEEPGHNPSPALSCREPGNAADMDSIQTSFWSLLLLQSHLSRESCRVKVAEEVRRQESEKYYRSTL